MWRGLRLACLPLILAVLQGSVSARAAPQEARPLRVVAFGTSLTARGSWPDDLGSALAACLHRRVETARVALPGATTAWARQHVPAVAALRPDIVLIEFSVNDAALNRTISPGESRRNFDAVLAALRERLPDAELYVMAMNPVFGLRGWLRPFLSRYLALHRQAALAAGANYVDFGPYWAARLANDDGAAIPDGLHPRPEIASGVIVPVLVSRLGGQCGAGAGRGESKEGAR